MKQVITTERIPIKLWLNDIEEGALEQAKNLANLPFAYKYIVILSDAHQGYGMPIGSVLATDHVISPHAVGSDISCLDAETEFLSPNGWKKISEWNNEKVLQYTPDIDVAEFVSPIKYIKKDCDKFYHFKTTRGLDMMLSSKHKLLTYLGYKERGYNRKDWIVEDFVKHHNSLKKGVQGGVKTTFKFVQKSKLNLKDIEIRLIAMISADGCIRERKTADNSVELHFRKKRKILRAQLLLQQANIKYKFTRGQDNSVFIYFKFDKAIKDLSIFWGADSHQLQILADEVLYWDGHKGEHEFFSTTKKQNADIIQFAFAVSDIRANIYSPKTLKNHSKIFIVYKTKSNITGFTKNCISEVNSVDNKQYCFTVSSGYFIVRRNGFIFATGNCGVAYMKTNINGNEINENIIKKILGGSKEFKGGVRSSIPMGMKHHSKKQIEWLSDAQKSELWGWSIIEKEYNSSLKQIGTLGSGNHFWQLSIDSTGFVSVMVHSGSRNIGFKVAKHYNEVAIELNEKWFSSVPKSWQLAFLPLNSNEGKAYYKEMQYCMEFAKKSRELMMEKSKEAILTSLPNTEFSDILDIHHNYASMENHFGKNVLVHRKGATKAQLGQLGIIPGSQGTASYIVEGLGNKESFESCSHGAGRKMSRKQAQKELDLELEKKRLDDKGIIHGIRNKNDLDEASGAYKDIDVVMENQKDLVKIVTKLEPIAVIKG